MSERRSSADLGANAEALLGAFPIPERDWESDARAIEARLSKSGPLDERLFAAPLPAEPGEPHSGSATATPLTHSGIRTQSLTELARRSVEKKRAEEREMARASFAIAATEKPSANDLRAPTQALADRNSAGLRPPTPPVRNTEQESAPARPPQRTGSSTWPKLVLATPLFALAAAALLWLRRPAAPLSVANDAVPTASTSEATQSQAVAPVVKHVPGASNSEPSAPHGIDPNTLPEEAEATLAEATHAKVGGVSSPPVAGNAPSSAAGRAALHGQRPLVAGPEPLKSAENSLPPDPALRPADSSGGELPAKPSSGAVQAALGAVLSGARHCVAGDDGPSSAVVRFGSDGRVQSVTVSGPATGKASGACIQAQLTKARVQPFAASNFSVSATIRPD